MLKLVTRSASLVTKKRFSFPIVSNVQIRQFGITDTIWGFANDKVEETKQKQFKTMIQLMTSEHEFSLRQYKETLEKQLSSWMMYIPGLGKSADSQQLKQFKGSYWKYFV